MESATLLVSFFGASRLGIATVGCSDESEFSCAIEMNTTRSWIGCPHRHIYLQGSPKKVYIAGARTVMIKH